MNVVRSICHVGVLLVCGTLNARAAEQRELRIAAAADLKFALDELATRYEKDSGIKIDATYGSSGNFFSQIQNGAPFDVFLSADSEYPRKLEASGFADSGTLYEYAAGRIVIWMPKSSGVDLMRLGWTSLLDARVEKVAIANPEHAPYGRAAVAALRRAGIYEQVRAKLVYGENISQAAQFVHSGNAQAGILALSLALSPPMKDGKRWDIPADMYPRMAQAAVILKSARDKEAARGFLAFLKSQAGRQIFDKYGFAAPSQAIATMK